LSSLPLQKYLVEKDVVRFDADDKGQNSKIKVFDYNALEESLYYIVKSLNKVVDTNDYSSKEARKGGEEQRALAIGVQGLADLFAELKISFTSEEARALNKKIFEAIYFYALKASCQLAKEQERNYKYFEGSPASEGILQFDMWGLNENDLSGLFDWNSLKEDIKKYGLLNSNVTGEMPTASSANVIGSNEAFEPFTYNMYTRKVKAGEFVLLNKYMVRHLEEENLWNDYIKSEIIKNNGSIQNIPVIEDSIKEIYKTVYEISQKELLSMSADRAPFVDQTQSQNIFMSKEKRTVKTLTSSHFYAWERGLKTGQYYLRSGAIDMKAQHLGMDLTKTLDESIATSNGEFDCFGCSS
jgi:ribonucleotide reductase alpha subunit